MAEKMTYEMALTQVLADCELSPEVAEKLEALKASISKKGANRKPTAKQKDNEALKDKILAFFAETPNQVYTITELQKANAELEELSNQKISALCNQLYKDGKLDKFVEKGRSLFQHKGE